MLLKTFRRGIKADTSEAHWIIRTLITHYALAVILAY